MATLGAPVRLDQANRVPRHARHVQTRPVQIRHAHTHHLHVRHLTGAIVACGGLLLMVAQVPFFVSIALTSPLAGRIGFSLLWLAIFTVGVHWRRRPARVLALAIALAITCYLLGVVAAPQLGWIVHE